MKTITTSANINCQGKLTADIGDRIPPGEHLITIIIQDRPEKSQINGKNDGFPFKWHTFKLSDSRVDSTYRREEIYNDDGR